MINPARFNTSSSGFGGLSFRLLKWVRRFSASPIERSNIVPARDITFSSVVTLTAKPGPTGSLEVPTILHCRKLTFAAGCTKVDTGSTVVTGNNRPTPAARAEPSNFYTADIGTIFEGCRTNGIAA
jgi:hypothetical protein